MDAEIFERDYVPAILQASRRTTIYISARDWLLGMSLRLNGYFRLGQTDLPNLELEAMRRIDVIDVTEFDQDLFRHFYYAESPRVLEDLAAVLDTCASPLRLATDEQPTNPEQEKLERRLQRNFYYKMRD
jgi:esterase/lipase superfamily enzyme